MSTPVCRTCDTKFPGKETCKTCGSDPNAEPTLDWKIEQAKATPQLDAKLMAHLTAYTARLSKGIAAMTEETKKADFTLRAKFFSAGQIAKLFQVPARLIVDQETLVKERSARRARIRSLQNTKQGRRRYKHGRVGVR